jgi:hypothetical protein
MGHDKNAIPPRVTSLNLRGADFLFVLSCGVIMVEIIIGVIILVVLVWFLTVRYCSKDDNEKDCDTG